MKHLLVKIKQLQEENAAMVKQLNDQDLRMEKQHREWSDKIELLQIEINQPKGEKEDVFKFDVVKVKAAAGKRPAAVLIKVNSKSKRILGLTIFKDQFVIFHEEK